MKDLPVQALLEWAFAKEKVRLEPQGAELDDLMPTFGIEYVLIKRAQLGVTIDGGGQSFGGSLPSEDAEAVAAEVSHMPDHLGGFRVACMVANCARLRVTPDWMPGAEPKLEPVAWTKNRHGSRGKTAVAETLTVIKGRKARIVEVRYTPCQWTPDPAQINYSRKAYLEWWAALDHIRQVWVGGCLRKHRVTDVMPPRRPWLRSISLATPAAPNRDCRSIG